MLYLYPKAGRRDVSEGTLVDEVVSKHKTATTDAVPNSVLPRLSWLAPLGVILAVIYGSLIPFDFDWSLLAYGSQADWPRLSGVWTTSEDLAVNILVYIPIGLAIALTGRRTILALMLRVAGAMIAGVSVSLFCEVTQLLIISRVGSWVDVCSNVAGATIGALIGLCILATAPFISQSVRRGLRAKPVAMASAMLTIGLFLFNLAPFDFAYHTSHLRDSYLHASWQVFGNASTTGQWQMSAERIADIAAALWFAVLALMVVYSRMRNGWRVGRAVASSIKHCMILIVVIEMTELFTRTQRFEISTIALRCCFAVAGACVSALVARGMTHSPVNSEPRRALPTSVLLVALAVQIGVLILWSLRPSHVEHLRNANPTFDLLPFVSLWRQSAVHALSDVFSRFVSVGALMVTAAIIFRRVGGMTTLPLAGMAVLSLYVFSIAVRCLTVTAHLDVTEPLIAFLSVVVVAGSYSRAVTLTSRVDFAQA